MQTAPDPTKSSKPKREAMPIYLRILGGVMAVFWTFLLVVMIGYFMDSSPHPTSTQAVGIFFLIALPIVIFASLFLVFGVIDSDKLSQENLVNAQARAEKEPEKAKPAWDIAKATLEAYFNRNLAQIRSIYTLSVIVMIVGFTFILGSIWLAIQNISNIAPAVVAAAAGVITEFIGATFLFVYRSTLQQATNYLNTLQQINTVGMAMQILDSLSEQQDEASKEKLVDAKITIAKLLLSNSRSNDKI